MSIEEMDILPILPAVEVEAKDWHHNIYLERTTVKPKRILQGCLIKTIIEELGIKAEK